MSSDPRWLLMKEIYFAALSLSGREREIYLREHCPDDSMVREVEKLLAESTESATALDTLDELVPRGLAFVPASTLAPGSELGHYSIRQKLGAGGMGLVYEATDEKLRRTVAIKVLPPGRTDDDMRRRLTREAQSASALNHPNIVTVYEVGREGETDFIAMERIHGTTLRQLIRDKGLGLRTTLEYAVQIADALAAAHDAGIVHRDLKPGNVMITERGLVKVLDFGIAKQAVKLADTVSSDDSSISRPGEVIGTLSYMSPEQARGKPVDARSDIFSFGSLVYEMLTGRRAFMEQTALATIEAVVAQDPAPLRDVVPNVPRGFERIISKCHQKKAVDRWQNLSDVKLILQDLIKDLDLQKEDAPEATTNSRRFGWVGLVAGMLVGAAVLWAGILFVNRGGPEAEPVLRMVSADAGLNTTPAISRDGRLLAYSSDRAKEDNLDIWLQQIGGREPIRLTSDPADETDPAFSPDGTRLAFRSEKEGGGIYVVPALGGDPVLLAPGGRNPRFSPDGTLVAYWTGREESSLDGSSHVFVLDAGGGQPRPIQPAMSYAQTPIWSPSGDALLAYGARVKDASPADWWILPLNNAIPPRQPAVRDRVLPSVRTSMPRALDWIDQDKPRVIYSHEVGNISNLWELDLTSTGKGDGPPRRLTRGPGRHVAANGTTTLERQRMAFADESLNFDIWIMPFDVNRGVPGKNLIRVTDRLSADWGPTLSSDGRRLVYISNGFGTVNVQSRMIDTGKERTHFSDSRRVVNARTAGDFSRIFFTNSVFDLLAIPTAGGTAENLCERCGTVIGVSSDGAYLAYEPKTDEDLFVLDVATRKTVTLAVRPDPKNLLSGVQFSRDGKWVVFSRTNTTERTTDVFIIPFRTDKPIPRDEWIPVTSSAQLARDPVWSPNGSIIYFNYEHDGFRCLGARRVDPATKKPVGDVFPIRHFHSARQSLRAVSSRRLLRSLSVSDDRMAFTLAEVTGNIWMEEKENEK